MNLFLSRASLAALPVALAASFSSVAQTQLQEVVVTATRSDQLLDAVLPHTTVISRQDIERSQATDLVTLLAREAGLQRTQTGGLGSVSSVFMRGTPSLQTLVLIDGVPQNKQDASGAVSLEHLMLDNIERVEIVRGNVSAIYGSGAIGGVIQIFTRRGTKDPSVGVSVELGPRASRKLSGNASASLGDTSISAGVTRITTHGFSANNTTQFISANPDDDGYRNTTLNLALIHQWSKDHSFGARAMQSESDAAYDNAYGGPADIQALTTRLNQTTMFTDNRWGGWRSRVSLSEQADKSLSRDNGVFGSVNGFITRTTLLNWVNTVALYDDWVATVGLEQQRQRVNTSSDSVYVTPYDQARNASAAFAGVEGAWGASSTQINLRHDKVGKLEKSTGYLGYGYRITDSFKLTTSISTAFNAPPLGYLFAPYYGNPELRPEHARSKELGLQYQQAEHLLRATYFDTRIRDQLTYDLVSGAFENLGRTRNTGVELSYNGRLDTTEIRASLTLQDPVDEITQRALVRRAATMLTVGISQPIGGWRLGADWRYNGSRRDAYSDPLTFSTATTTLGAYSVLDLTASYKLSPELMFKMRLDNVADEKYQTVYGYNQQPRSLYMGLTWTPTI